VFCSTCGKRCEDEEIGEPIECVDFAVQTFKCPHCKSTHHIKTRASGISDTGALIRQINTRRFKNAKFYKFISPSNPSGWKTYEGVLHDPESGKLSLFVRYLNIISTPNGIIFEPYYDKCIFNYKTHMTYVIKNKTFKGKLTFGADGRTLLNKTYARSGYGFGYQIGASIEAIVACAKAYFEIMHIPMGEEMIAQACNVSIDGVEALTQEDKAMLLACTEYKADVLSLIFTANRFPNMLIQYDGYRKTGEILQNHKAVYLCDNFLREFPKELTDYQNWARSVISKHKLPKSKRFWKLYMQNPKFLDRILYLRKCGFKNSDVIHSVVEHGDFLAAIEDNYYGSGQKNPHSVMIKIIKTMNNHSNESAVAKRLTKLPRDSWYLSDMCNMYEKVREHDKKLLDTIDWHGSLVEIHDDLSLITTKIRYANKVIPYTKEDGKLEREVGDYVFKLAEDTNELVAIGQEMKICVGSYRESVLSRNCIIVAMKSDDKYVGCIELDRGWNLRQLKGKRNAYLVGPASEAAKKWLKTVGIHGANKCNDFVHLGETIETHHDYHHFELDEEGNVVDVYQRAHRHNPFEDDEMYPF
jgi:hypothetical protein